MSRYLSAGRLFSRFSAWGYEGDGRAYKRFGASRDALQPHSQLAGTLCDHWRTVGRPDHFGSSPAVKTLRQITLHTSCKGCLNVRSIDRDLSDFPARLPLRPPIILSRQKRF